jgi:hypothetical protein
MGNSHQKGVAMRSLLGEYLALHGVESRGARAELEQLKGLLADAAARLTAGFEEVGTLASRQRDIALGVARALQRGIRIPPAAAANDGPGDATVAAPLPPAASSAHTGDLGTVTADIERAICQVATALQFQDIATQLVGHTAARLERLERIAGDLGRLPDATADELGEALAAARGAPHGGPVSQRQMNEGGVELF